MAAWKIYIRERERKAMRFYRRKPEGPWQVDFWHNGRRFRPSTDTTDIKKAKEWAERHKAALWRADRLDERPTVTWTKPSSSG